MKQPITVAMLFSGGDCPGMNPLLRAVVRLGLNKYGATILGIKDGYQGLVRTCHRISNGELQIDALKGAIAGYRGRDGLWRKPQDLVLFDHAAVDHLSSRGGIVLGSSRCSEFEDVLIRKQVIDLLDTLGVDAVIVCGGNGSLTGAWLLAAEGALQVIGVPGTIDNDVVGTETALGVDTAVNTLVWAIERIDDTAHSHHRIMVLETMGCDCGELARRAGLASEAEIVVTPERGLLTVEKMEGIARRLEKSLTFGLDSGIVIVAEGVKPESQSSKGPAMLLARFLQDHFRRPNSEFSEIEVRASVLGHLQRGGSPTAADRLLAAQFADAAWNAIAMQPESSGVLGLLRGRIEFHPFAANCRRKPAQPAEELYALHKNISRWMPESDRSSKLFVDRSAAFLRKLRLELPSSTRPAISSDN